MLVLFAAMMFGGTFTCKSSEDSDQFTSNPSRPAK